MKNASEVRLQQTKGIGPKRYTSILAKLQELHQTADDLFAMPASEIAAVFKLPKNIAQAILNSPQTIQLELTPALPLKEAQQLINKDIKILKQSGSDYPTRLTESGDPKIPHQLYYWGNLELLKKPSVGFCGARDASPESLEATADIAKQATTLGWTVVSGHARGVDTAAHRAALENGGHTILVIPEGILNFKLRSELKAIAKPEQLLIISEFDPKARWSVANAMTRNRTIIGLSDAMISG
jgi:DNA processing protein